MVTQYFPVTDDDVMVAQSELWPAKLWVEYDTLYPTAWADAAASADWMAVAALSGLNVG